MIQLTCFYQEKFSRIWWNMIWWNMPKTLPVPRNLGLHDCVGDELNKIGNFY